MLRFLYGFTLFAMGLLCHSTSLQAQVGGIIIDGDGAVKTVTHKPISKTALKRLQDSFAQEQLDATLIEQSATRILSLNELDTAVTAALKAGAEIPPTFKYLGGLQRIDFLVVDRERQDLLIAGPAEGFGPGPGGQILGLTTQRPPIQLDDLVIALRSILGGQRELGVSIDPTEQNMSNLQNYIRQNSNATTTAAAQRRYQTMGKVLGNQVITIWGVPDDSHFALALAEADLRMKRISLGLDPSGVREIRSQLSMLLPQGNSLQRWWFMPYYESIATNADRSVFEFKGQRAQLMAQEEIVGPDGQRFDAASTRRTTQKFAEQFTEHFEKIAAVNPAFAELQSLYDLSLVATLARDEWPFANRNEGLPTLLKDERLPLQSHPVPKFVTSAATSRKSSNGLLLGLIGGVTIDMNRVVKDVQLQTGLQTAPFKKESGEQNWWWNGPARTPPTTPHRNE